MRKVVFLATFFSLLVNDLALAKAPTSCQQLATAALGSISENPDRATLFLQNGANKLLSQRCGQTRRPLIISSQFSLAEIDGQYSGSALYEYFCVPRKSSSVPVVGGLPCFPE